MPCQAVCLYLYAERQSCPVLLLHLMIPWRAFCFFYFWRSVQVVATNVTGDFRECRSDVVVWPLVTVMVAMATLLVVYAIIPLAAPYQYRLLYEYAVLPRLLQGVVVGVSCIAVSSPFFLLPLLLCPPAC